MKNYVHWLSLLVFITVSNCDEREIDFIQNTPFLFSASIGEDFLIKDEIYQLGMDIRLQDEVLENLSYSLDYQIENGSGVLFQNGFPFESGDRVDIEDSWTYQPTSVGEQSISLTLSDNTGASKRVTLDVEVGDFIPVNFDFNANFKDSETTVQSDTEFLIELTTDDPQMEYVLNYEIMEGAGIIKNSKGVKIGENYPIETGTTTWAYHATKPDNQQLKLKIRDENGDERTRNLTIYAVDQIPFSITATATPSTIRQSKSSEISVKVASEHTLFETLNFTMEYTSNFGSDARLLDKNNVSIPQNSPVGIDKKDNLFTYKPVVPGTHNITITVTDQEGNSESTVVTVSSKAPQNPLVQAVSSMELGLGLCTPQGFGSIEECSAQLTLKFDMNGSIDQDKELGGHISDYKISIDGTDYTGPYNSQNPVFSLDNGEVTYTKIKETTSDYKYSVKHKAGATIRVELKDDDGLWSEVKLIKVPEYPQ